MKLRNKKTGEIVDFKIIADYDDCTSGWRLEKYDGSVLFYDHIDEIREEWEDYEEAKEFYSIYYDGSISRFTGGKGDDIEDMKEIGNYFETKEEAERAAEKLKAWKRLKDKGFKFSGWTHTPITKSLTGYNLHIKAYTDKLADYMDDIQLLFGGEE